MRLFSVAALLAVACTKRAVPADASGSDAAAAVVEASAPAFAHGSLATLTIGHDETARLTAIDVAHTRAVIEVGVGGASPHPTEIVAIDWATHLTTRVALRNLGEGLSGARTAHVDFGDPETVAEIAAYGHALAGARSFDAHVAAAPNAIFLRFADALCRANLDGRDARHFGPMDARDAIVSPRGDVVAYIGCDAECFGPTAYTLRIADIAPPSRERRVAVVNPGALTFSPDGDVLYASAWPNPSKPACLVSVRVSTGETKQLACATVVEPLDVLVAPSAQLAALSAWGGPSGIGGPELTLVALPAGTVKARQRLTWSMESYTALTDRGELLGTTFTNQWGSPGHRVVSRQLGDAGLSSVGASEEFEVESFALTNRNSVIALAIKRTDANAQLELAELPLRP
jgi:hypothetical protein